MFNKHTILFSVFVIILQIAADELMLKNEINQSPFTVCSNTASDEIICNFVNCSYTKGQSLSKSNYIRIDDIRNSQPPGYLLKLQLFIRGNKDGHIVLSPDNSNMKLGASKYDIVIGALRNKQTHIYKNTQPLRVVDTPLVLDSAVPNEYSIEITRDGIFQIKKQDEVLLRAADRPLPIKYIKLASFNGSILDYFYNCSNNEPMGNNEATSIEQRPSEKQLLPAMESPVTQYTITGPENIRNLKTSEKIVENSTASSVEQQNSNFTENNGKIENRTELHTANVLLLNSGSTIRSSFHLIFPILITIFYSFLSNKIK